MRHSWEQRMMVLACLPLPFWCFVDDATFFIKTEEILKTLIVIIGPTGIGKTALSLDVAESLGCPILSADSRQFYRDLPIGTAAPTAEEQARVKHYFVGQLGLEEYYSAARYEEACLQVIESEFARHEVLVLTGGSMLYVDAVCNGIDDIPTINEQTRQWMRERFEKEGLPALVEELRQLDPEYHAICDLQNPKRVVHALEICHQSGHTYTSFRVGVKKRRPFRILKIGLRRERDDLFARINARVGLMVEQGLLDEARRVLPYRHCNSLNTVGYKELFKHFDGDWELDFALDRMRKNTRVYAKKQMTWFNKDPEIHWFHPDNEAEIRNFIQNQTDYPC